MATDYNQTIAQLKASLGMSTNVTLNDKLQFKYEFLILQCPKINTLPTIVNPIAQSYYRYSTALIGINEIDTNIDMNGIRTFKEYNKMRDIFYNNNIVIDLSILDAINSGEFKYKLDIVSRNGSTITCTITFVRMTLGTLDPECCYNVNDDGIALNHYTSTNSKDYGVNPNDTQYNYVSNLFGNKSICDPRFKRIEMGMNICRDELNDFCSEEDANGVPRIIAKNSNGTLKHPRCSIDFRKFYSKDYGKVMNDICNDYNSGFQDSDLIKTYMDREPLCRDFCENIEPSKCARGQKKYCSEKYMDIDRQMNTRLFHDDCINFMKKQDDNDVYLEKFCIKETQNKAYQNPICINFRDKYERCIINKDNSNTEECKDFYRGNPNITATDFNKACEVNPTLKICNQKIIQKNIYNNKFEGTPNEYFAVKNLRKDEPKLSIAGDDFIITNNPEISTKIIEDKIKYCIKNNNQDPICPQLVNNYMHDQFITRCIRGNSEVFIKDEICKLMKDNANLTGYDGIEANFCTDRNSSVYSNPKCIGYRSSTNNIKKLFYAFGIFGVIAILYIIFMIIKKYI
jgi:hypothetical protein